MIDNFLITLFSVQQARRKRVLFGLLKNQLTVSTLYGGLRYQLLAYIGLLPTLEITAFDQAIEQLVATGKLQVLETVEYILTATGQAEKEAYQVAHVQPSYAQTETRLEIPLLLEAFLLANQVVSEFSFHNKHYYPLQFGLAVNNLVKTWFRQQDRATLAQRWHASMVKFLQTLSDEEAERWVALLAGHHTPGALWDDLNLPSTWGPLDLQQWQMNKLVDWLAQAQPDEPLVALQQLVQNEAGLPRSVGQTLQSMLNGQPLEQIAQQRHLKIGTIREHILTAAICLPKDVFPFQRVLRPAAIATLDQQLTGPADTWQYQQVRQTGEPAEFFIFRLYSIWRLKEELAHAK